MIVAQLRGAKFETGRLDGWTPKMGKDVQVAHGALRDVGAALGFHDVQDYLEALRDRRSRLIKKLQK